MKFTPSTIKLTRNRRADIQQAVPSGGRIVVSGYGPFGPPPAASAPTVKDLLTDQGGHARAEARPEDHTGVDLARLPADHYLNRRARGETNGY